MIQVNYLNEEFSFLCKIFRYHHKTTHKSRHTVSDKSTPIPIVSAGGQKKSYSGNCSVLEVQNVVSHRIHSGPSAEHRSGISVPSVVSDEFLNPPACPRILLANGNI